MLRRIYFTFPRPEQVHQVVDELERVGVNRSAMHCLAKEGIDLSGLPMATEEQRADHIWYWDQILWKGALISFAVLLSVGVFYLFNNAMAWGLGMLGLAVVVFIAGAYFATRVPHVHLDQMQVPVQHGEVVLLIDVPRERVTEVTQLVEGRHSEAALGGVGWTLNYAGL